MRRRRRRRRRRTTTSRGRRRRRCDGAMRVRPGVAVWFREWPFRFQEEFQEEFQSIYQEVQTCRMWNYYNFSPN
jgi:hypothetical protein